MVDKDVKAFAKRLNELAPGTRFSVWSDLPTGRRFGPRTVKVRYNPDRLKELHPGVTEKQMRDELKAMFASVSGNFRHVSFSHITPVPAKVSEHKKLTVPDELREALHSATDEDEQLLAVLNVLAKRLTGNGAGQVQVYVDQFQTTVTRKKFKKQMGLEDDFPDSWVDEAIARG